jgi:hypothetical protein
VTTVWRQVDFWTTLLEYVSILAATTTPQKSTTGIKPYRKSVNMAHLTGSIILSYQRHV